MILGQGRFQVSGVRDLLIEELRIQEFRDFMASVA